MSEPSRPQSFLQQLLIPLIVVAGIFVLSAIIFGILSANNIPIRSYTAPPSPAPTVDADMALVRFRRRLMALPHGEQLFLSIDSTSPGVAEIKVSNIWYQSRPYERRQFTQMIANVWRAEMKGETVVLSIRDITGREIAGTKMFGGVWIEEDE